jgi:hypothetical protein
MRVQIIKSGCTNKNFGCTNSVRLNKRPSLPIVKLTFFQDIKDILSIDCNLNRHPLKQFKRARCPQTHVEYFIAPCTCTISFDGRLLSATVEWNNQIVGEGQYIFTGDHSTENVG